MNFERGLIPGKLTPGTPSIWNGRIRTCQWIELSSSRSFTTGSFAVCPPLRRTSGAGTVPLIPIARLSLPPIRERKSVVSGTSGSVRVDHGGGRIIKKKKQIIHIHKNPITKRYQTKP